MPAITTVVWVVRFPIGGMTALIFTIAIGFLLVGLTNKGGTHLVGTALVPNDWADVVVGGFIAVGVALTAVFLAVEARAKEPIVPLDLWRNRTYVSSMLATFAVKVIAA